MAKATEPRHRAGASTVTPRHCPYGFKVVSNCVQNGAALRDETHALRSACKFTKDREADG
jgi:hypothetical protein